MNKQKNQTDLLEPPQENMKLHSTRLHTAPRPETQQNLHVKGDQITVPSARSRTAEGVMFHAPGEGFPCSEQLSPCQLTETALHDEKEIVLFSLAGEIKHLHFQRRTT